MNQDKKNKEHKNRVTNRLYETDKQNIVIIFGSVQKGLDWLSAYCDKKVKATIVKILIAMLIVAIPSCNYSKHVVREYKTGKDTLVTARHYYRGNINQYNY